MARPDDAMDEARLAAVLHELVELRIGLETDLTIAAAALDAGDPQVASAVLEENHGHLAGAFATTAATGGVRRLRRPAQRFSTSTGASVAAACLAAFALLGGAQATGPSTALSSRVAQAEQAYDDLVEAVSTDSWTAVALADQLHASLEPLILAGALDPASARRALAILQHEQVMLLSALPGAAQRLLAEADRLVALLHSTVPGVVPDRALTKPPLVLTVPTPRAVSSPDVRPEPTQQRATATAPASPSAPPTATPKPSPTGTPRPTTRPEPTASPEPIPFPETVAE